MIRLLPGCVLAAILCSGLHAVDDQFEVLDEKALRRADLQIDERDYRQGLKLLFMILRRAERDVMRGEARERLERLGISSQNIFQLEIETLKSSELEELLSQVSAHVAMRTRREADFYHAQRLLASGLIVRQNSEGQLKTDVASRDVLTALKMLMEYALGEDPDGARRAQQLLEGYGISGKKVDFAKQSIKDDKLAPEVLGEMIPAAAVVRLRQYHEWLRDVRDGGENENPRRRVAREQGVALLQFIAKEYPDSVALRRHADTLDFFRDKATEKQDKF